MEIACIMNHFGLKDDQVKHCLESVHDVFSRFNESCKSNSVERIRCSIKEIQSYAEISAKYLDDMDEIPTDEMRRLIIMNKQFYKEFNYWSDVYIRIADVEVNPSSLRELVVLSMHHPKNQIASTLASHCVNKINALLNVHY